MALFLSPFFSLSFTHRPSFRFLLLYYARTYDLNHTRPVTDATLGAIFVATGGHKGRPEREKRREERDETRRGKGKVRFKANLALVLQLPPVLSPDWPIRTSSKRANMRS